MENTTEDILERVHDYEQTPEGYAMGLRLDLAQIVIRGLKTKGWTSRDLARKLGCSDGYISEVLHSNANPSFETVGRLLFALGIEAKLQEILLG